ncbi:OmpA family protein [Leptospira gomenensis]|uniref:OmpA family protein n=1 Tax=Leptospira gomenensis TaxID=2484974 RepID=A0A5F1Y9B5_9LEPT|nr:OmpA family protein [Leptospira gomenensis]TGK32701.1 OmpA family protein [Leptospira gomenensis]TGK36848.1 OmpA family protein [Leptospira gomenensis]TGK39924.1 OmpA family protein [Leptospira gomenensis]TGK58059.1 OmpA family protein [Leptospira gomenensis]
MPLNFCETIRFQRKRFLLPVLIYLTYSLCGCHQTVIIPSKLQRIGDSSEDVRHISKSYILGYFEGGHERAECAEGIENISIKRGLGDLFVHVVIGGLFNTRSVEVNCIKPKSDFVRNADSMVLKGVHFRLNSDQIRPESFPVLDGLANYLAKRKFTRILISGHTDLTGDKRANEELSEKRASATKKYLVSKGIGSGRIETLGFGSRRPIVRSLDDNASVLNRRIEIQFLKDHDKNTDFPEDSETSGLIRVTLKNGTYEFGNITQQNETEIHLERDGKVKVLSKRSIKKVEYRWKSN